MLGAGRGDDEEGSGGLVGSLVMAIIAPIAAMLIQMAVSRSRSIWPMSPAPGSAAGRWLWPMPCANFRVPAR